MTAPRPYTLIAELTYRCPLSCPYCSNPVVRTREELPAETWERAIDDAAALGVVQLHLTGGEPLLYRDLERLVARGRARELYVNLITSGIALTRERLARLHEAGLDHVQLSIQDVTRASCDSLAGARVFDRKHEVAAWVVEEGLAFTLNVVLHSANIERVPEIVELAVHLGAQRLELANVQYLGVAFENRNWLAPEPAQLERAFEQAAAARDRLLGKLEVIFVKPDLHGTTPRACMDGWARRYIHVTPAGRVLPCHAAEIIRELAFDSLRDRPLAEIWEHSPALARFRGHGWMTEPCRSCERRDVDFGGCRCRAYLLAGDAAATDPACALAPGHGAARVERTYQLRVHR